MKKAIANSKRLEIEAKKRLAVEKRRITLAKKKEAASKNIINNK